MSNGAFAFMQKISLNTPLTMNPLCTSTLFGTSTNLWEGHFSLPYVKYIFLLFPSNCGICLFDLTERDWFRADKIILSKSEEGREGKSLLIGWAHEGWLKCGRQVPGNSKIFEVICSISIQFFLHHSLTVFHKILTGS